MILLTGASGWIGKNALLTLESIIGPKRLRKELFPVTSNIKPIDFGSSHGPITSYTFSSLPNCQKPSLILHAAFLKRSAIAVLGLKEFTRQNRQITSSLLDLLSLNPNCPIVSISSGAAATCLRNGHSLKENPYGFLKLEEESMIESMCMNRNATVFRVYSCIGPFLPMESHYALTSFVKAARESSKILIKSNGKLWRSYVHLPELMMLCWRILMDEKQVGFKLVDACSEVVEIGSIAEYVADCFESCIIERDLISTAQEGAYVGNSTAYRRLLRYYNIAEYSLADGIKESIEGVL